MTATSYEIRGAEQLIVYLVRHGETDWNKIGKIQGHADVPLNEYGRRLAVLTAEGLRDVPFEKVYSSPLKRARETADIIQGDRGLEIADDDRLMEMGFGDGEGKMIRKVCRNPFCRLHNFFRHPQWYRIPPKGGETFRDLHRRTVSFMKEEVAPLEGTYDYVLVSTHGGVIHEVLCWIGNIRRADFWKGAQNNCSVNILECRDGHFRVLEAGKIYYRPEEQSETEKLTGKA